MTGWRSRSDAANPGVTDALERVYETSQALLYRKLELWLDEGRQLVVAALGTGIVLLIAAGGYWTAIAASLAIAVEDVHTRSLVEVGVGAAHAIVGALVVRRCLGGAGARER